MKLFKLIFLVALGVTVLAGCERQLVSPIKDIPDPSQITTQFAQEALLNLAETAAERKFVDLANVANDVAETLIIDDGTSVEPIFSKIAKLAHEATVLEYAFVEAGCQIEFGKFAKATVDAVKAYTIRDATDMQQALQNLAQKTVTAEIVLGQLPAANAFIPFAFGYSSSIDYPECWCSFPDWDYPNYEFGEIVVEYDTTIRPVSETRASIIEFLSNKGYIGIKVESGNVNSTWIDFGAFIDPLLIMNELLSIPGIAQLTHPIVDARIDIGTVDDSPPPLNIQIIDRVRTRYNQAWCQGNFAVIDSILIEESGLDFFNYAFVRNLADIYAEEIPETAERIQMNLFYLRLIAIEFLKIHLHDSEKPLDEVIEIFRQSVRDGNVDIDHDTHGQHYYLTTDYWKQLVTDYLNQ